MLLKDKVALITGAGDGIGKAIALAMAREGAHIVSVDIDGDAAKRTANEVGEFQVKELALETDVGDTKQIDDMVVRTIDTFGRLDIIVNNAGVTRRAGIMELTEEDWDRIHRVNAKGVFFCLQSAARRMIEQGSGCIINIASIAGRGYIGASNAAYAASKGAVIALTRKASQELGPYNININAICPGVTLTPLGERNRVIRAQEQGVSIEQALENSVKPIPIRRANDPKDIAALAVFLAAPGARNITGQSYNVDGGLIPS